MTLHVLTLGLTALLLAGDPFVLLGPRVPVSDADRRNLERGETVAGTMPGGKDQVAVFAVSRIDVSPDVLITSARAIDELKRSSFVQAIHRFSDPPRIEDLDTLVLPPRDVQAAITCTVGNCSLKLSAAEIGTLQQAALPRPDRSDRIQQAFRRIVLQRVNAYRAGGLESLPPIVNRDPPWSLDRVFKAITAAMPQLDAAYDESFVYWSQETYGAGKPVVLVTHVGLVPPRRPGAPAIVIGKQIMATRYMTGGVSVTAITTDPRSGRRYLIYLNRSGVDLLGGVLGPIKRSVLESRLESDVPEIIQKLRQRLEQTAKPATR